MEQTLEKLTVGAQSRIGRSRAQDQLVSDSDNEFSPVKKGQPIERLVSNLPPGSPMQVEAVVKAMFTKKEHWPCAAMFIWGVVSGLLSVGVTLCRQAGVL